jgi:hypothetical protein
MHMEFNIEADSGFRLLYFFILIFLFSRMEGYLTSCAGSSSKELVSIQNLPSRGCHWILGSPGHVGSAIYIDEIAPLRTKEIPNGELSQF